MPPHSQHIKLPLRTLTGYCSFGKVVTLVVKIT